MNTILHSTFCKLSLYKITLTGQISLNTPKHRIFYPILCCFTNTFYTETHVSNHHLYLNKHFFVCWDCRMQSVQCSCSGAGAGWEEFCKLCCMIPSKLQAADSAVAQSWWLMAKMGFTTFQQSHDWESAQTGGECYKLPLVSICKMMEWNVASGAGGGVPSA